MYFKHLAAVFLLAVSTLVTIPFSAYAAPKTMSDGTVFDAEYYAVNNPDVVTELGTGETSLYTHYKMFGQSEGRLPYAVSSDGSVPIAVYDGVEFYKDDAGQITMLDSSGRFMNSNGNKVTAAVIASTSRSDYLLYHRAQADSLRDSFGILGVRYLLGYTGHAGTIYFYNDHLNIAVSADTLLSLYQQEAAFESAYIPELQSKICDGSSQQSAVITVAQYVANKLVYDRSILGNTTKNKLHCRTSLTDGVGICHDYAEAFAGLIALVPVNDAGVVDWSSGARNTIKADIVCSPTHAWNTVTYDGVTHQVDVCFYDATRNIRWLDMGAAEQADASHHIGAVSAYSAYLF